MPELYNNIMCISAAELTQGDNPIMSENAYKLYVYRNPHVRARKAGGLGNCALLRWDLLRQDLKDKYVEKYGNPSDNTALEVFKRYLKIDEKALEFYSEYTASNGESLPADRIEEYCRNVEVLNALHGLIQDRRAMAKALGGKVRAPFKQLTEIVNNLKYGHNLPQNHVRLREKYNDYIKNGYAVMIHSGFANKNTEKISDDAKLWILSMWVNQVQKVTSVSHLLTLYNNESVSRNWKAISTEQTLRNFLFSESVKPLWWGHRYGELEFKEKFTYQHTTKLPSMRDSLWYSDGTKLNYFYLEDGKIKTINVYEVMDSYSEVLLGYCIAEKEDYKSQFSAFRMAIQVSGQRPCQIGFDNQGGHKKLESAQLIKKISHIAISTMPYNGKSKSIESAFGRFQAEFLKRDWFFTGQNIQAKKQESKANMEFVLANRSSLPSLQEIKEIYKTRRNEWNNALHPRTGVPRMQMYKKSHNPEAVTLQIWDIINVFWLLRPEPVTVTAYGINFKEKKEQKQYMVFKNDSPDVNWLKNNIDKKVWIKTDPEDSSMIAVYDKDSKGELRFMTYAQSKTVIHRGKQEQDAWEAEFIKEIENANKRVRIETRDKMDEILEQHGLLPEQNGLRSPKVAGVESSRKKGKASAIGKLKKAESMVTADDDEFDLYKIM